MLIRRDIDDRILIFVASLLLCCGCLVQPGTTPKKPAKPATTTGLVELTRVATIEHLHESAKAIDDVADRVKSGEIKYDKQLQDALQVAFNAGLRSPENKKLSAEMAKILNQGEKFDPAKTEAALRANANGRRAVK